MFVSHTYHIFLKLSDSPLVYGTTTYPTLDLSAVLEVFPVFVVLLLLTSEALFVMVTSDSMLWSCDVWFPMVFWVVAVLVLLSPAWMLLLSLFSPSCC